MAHGARVSALGRGFLPLETLMCRGGTFLAVERQGEADGAWRTVRGVSTPGVGLIP